MDRLRVLLVAVMLAVAVGAAAAAPAGAKGGNSPPAAAALHGRVAHGTTSQGEAILVSLVTPPKPRFVELQFAFAVSCGDGSTYKNVARMRGVAVPYVTSGGGSRLETRVRYDFAPTRLGHLQTPVGIVDVRVRIRVKGVIRVLSETHLRATGTIEPSLELPTGVTCTEPTITHSAHTGLP